MNILEQIILHKRRELAERKKERNINEWEKSGEFSRPVHSLVEVLNAGKKTGIIAEFKRCSPSRGLINGNADVHEVTLAYTQSGASGLSVLTDEKYFGGLIPDLLKARIHDIPILRKDFIIDEYQVITSRSIGADVVLLIAAGLTPGEVRQLAATAKRIGLETLLEVHNEKELGHFCDHIDMVGVNNRDLNTFQVDLDTSFKLIEKLPAGVPAIAESGIDDVQTILKLKDAGYKGFLIGERFMREKDPGRAFKDFSKELL